MESFSQRYGLQRPDPEISIRFGFPDDLRDIVAEIAYKAGLAPSDLRHVLCTMLYKAPDSNNWSEYPNIAGEVGCLIHECEWFEVYDFIELIATQNPNCEPIFSDEINRMFRYRGIGWQLRHAQLEIRGTEAFEGAIEESHTRLIERGNATAAGELHEAIRDLSRRPKPEVSGAIQHAMTALECVARDVAGSKERSAASLLKIPTFSPSLWIRSFKRPGAIRPTLVGT